MSKINYIVPNHAFISENSLIGKNVTIFPSVYIGDNVKIGNNVTIQTGTIIKDNVVIDDNVFIGPFSLIRDNVKIGNNSKIGPHCELKETIICQNVNVAHKNFIGNCKIFDNVNIGCGSIIANYNNGKYNETIIGENTKIGINCSIIAPIIIGKNCFIAAASVLRQDIPDGSFFITKYESEIRPNKYIPK